MKQLNNIRIQQKWDTINNWRANNPVLLPGEIGFGTNAKGEVVTMKVGDGIHSWNDLSFELGSKEEQMQQAEENMVNALKQIQGAARACGVSMGEAMSSLSALAKAANDFTVMPGDAGRRAKYKTLNPTYEIK